jgi:cytochrome c556
MMFEPNRSFARGMWFPTVLAILLGITASAMTAAQDKNPYPVFSADQFIAAMKTIGQAFTAANGAMGADQGDDAKAYIAITRDRLATTVTFWRDRKRDDALKMLRQTIEQLDQLDAALSTDAIDKSAVSNLTRQIGASCQSCHEVYREQDPATKAFKFRGLSE